MSTSQRRPPDSDNLFIVGLVGRTGSGKSTLAGLLAERGARVIEGDALGHQVTDRDPEVRAALIAEYGPSVYRADGTLDRAMVAARVFRDPAARERLDRLVHPRIVDLIYERLEQWRAEAFHGTVVIDAALLLDWGVESWCDVVIAVIAPEADQIARLEAARGWSEDEARARLQSQRTPEEFAAAADITLRNAGGSREALEAMARDTATQLESMRAFHDRPAARPRES